MEIVFWLSAAVVLYTYFGYPLLLLGCHFACLAGVQRAARRNVE